MNCIEPHIGQSLLDTPSSGSFRLSTSELPWYVVYTCPRHEKFVAHQMNERQISCFLPLYASLRRWKDRTKRLELPLFPGYLFVQMTPENRISILGLPGVVQFVCFQGKPAPVSATELESLRQGTNGSMVVQPHPFLQAGRRVRVVGGSMAGLEGIFLRRKDQNRIVISISLIQRSVSVEIGEAEVAPL